jgi:hypothetical protein
MVGFVIFLSATVAVASAALATLYYICESDEPKLEPARFRRLSDRR